jgi:hypothetical protein
MDKGLAGFWQGGRVWFIKKHGICQGRFGAVKNRAFCSNTYKKSIERKSNEMDDCSSDCNASKRMFK